jgi:hypothetical protein
VTWFSFAKTQVDAFFLQVRPEAVFVAAANVGGIYANATYHADFLYDNLLIAAKAWASYAVLAILIFNRRCRRGFFGAIADQTAKGSAVERRHTWALSMRGRHSRSGPAACPH